MTTSVTPSIYIADLAEYNAGNLRGEWITVDPEWTAADLEAEMNRRRVLAAGHEEWAIHDFEGFGPVKVEEYDTFETVLEHVRRICEDAPRYFAFIDAMGESYADQYDDYEVSGPYESLNEFAQNELDELVLGPDTLSDFLVKAGVPAGFAQCLTFDTDEYINLLRNDGMSFGWYGRDLYAISSK